MSPLIVYQHDSAVVKNTKSFTNKFRARFCLLEEDIFEIAPRFLHTGRRVYDETTIKKRGGIAVFWCNGEGWSQSRRAYGCGSFWILCHCAQSYLELAELFEVRWVSQKLAKKFRVEWCNPVRGGRVKFLKIPVKMKIQILKYENTK